MDAGGSPRQRVVYLEPDMVPFARRDAVPRDGRAHDAAQHGDDRQPQVGITPPARVQVRAGGVWGGANRRGGPRASSTVMKPAVPGGVPSPTRRPRARPGTGMWWRGVVVIRPPNPTSFLKRSWRPARHSPTAPQPAPPRSS